MPLGAAEADHQRYGQHPGSAAAAAVAIAIPANAIADRRSPRASDSVRC